jgi:hypothetical protein
MKAFGDKLFPKIKADARGYISGKPSTFFNARVIGVKTDRSTISTRSGTTSLTPFERPAIWMSNTACCWGTLRPARLGDTACSEGPLRDRVTMIEAIAF